MFLFTHFGRFAREIQARLRFLAKNSAKNGLRPSRKIGIRAADGIRAAGNGAGPKLGGLRPPSLCPRIRASMTSMTSAGRRRRGPLWETTTFLVGDDDVLVRLRKTSFWHFAGQFCENAKSFFWWF